jgi:hypothetical protein
MNVGGMGAFAGGLAGSFTKQEEMARFGKLADAEVDLRGAQSAKTRAETAGLTDRRNYKLGLGALLREKGLHNLAAGVDGGPADPAAYAQWVQQQQPDNAPAPTLTQPGAGPLYGQPPAD